MYSNRASIPGEYLYKDTEGQEVSENWEELQIEKTGENPLMCSHCKKRKIYVYTKLKSRRDGKTITFKRTLLINKEFRELKAA